jgi:hypothetical protein
VTIFLVILSIVGWLLVFGGLIVLGIVSLAFAVQEARMNELKADLELMTRRANLFEPKGENKDI